jgi:hypothetical protein
MFLMVAICAAVNLGIAFVLDRCTAISAPRSPG